MTATYAQPSPVRRALGLLLTLSVLGAPGAAPYLDAGEPHHAPRVQSPVGGEAGHVHHDHRLCLQIRDAPAHAAGRVTAITGSGRLHVRAARGPQGPHLSHPQRRLSPARAPPLG